MGIYSMDRAHEMGVRLQPWRTNGTHVLICSPGPMAGSDFCVDMLGWNKAIRRRVEAETDRPVRVREKKARETRPLEADLEDACA